MNKKTTMAALVLGLSMLSARAEDVLRFATWDSNEALEIQKKIAAMFEQKHPGVKVQVEAYGDGFDQKIAAAFGAKNPPDVMYMWDFPTYSPSLEPLDAYLAKDKSFNANDLAPGLLNYTRLKLGSRQGKTYGLPAGFTSHVVYYNKDMFDKAGVAYPKAGWTWADLKAAAARLRNKDKKAFGFGIDANPDPYDFQSYLWSAGASMVSADGKRIQGSFNSAQSKAMFGMLVDLVNQDQAALLGVGDNKSYRELFLADKLAMVESGTWPKADFEKAGKRFGVAPLPSFQGKPAKSVVNISAVSVAKDSQHKQLAWEFVKFYTSPEAVRLRTNDLPVLMSVASEQKLLDDPNVRPFYDMLKGARETPAFLLNPNWSRAQEVLGQGIQEVFLKRTDVAGILDRAAVKAERKLK